MNIGGSIKSIRKKKGVRQAELAQRANITQSYLSQIENNRKEPNLSTLTSIADKLDVPLPILFFISLEEGDVSEDRTTAYSQLYPQMRELISDICDV